MSHQRLNQEQKEALDRQADLEEQQAREESHKIFLEKQRQKAQKAREEGRSLQDHYVQQMVSFHSFNLDNFIDPYKVQVAPRL